MTTMNNENGTHSASLWTAAADIPVSSTDVSGDADDESNNEENNNDESNSLIFSPPQILGHHHRQNIIITDDTILKDTTHTHNQTTFE